MADENPGSIPVGGIYATVQFDGTEAVDAALQKMLDRLTAGDSGFDRLAQSAKESSEEVQRAITREVEHNLREKEREANERAAIVSRTMKAELDADRERQRAFNEALAGQIEARATAADAEVKTATKAADDIGAVIARTNAKELEQDRETQRAKNRAIFESMQARATAEDSEANDENARYQATLRRMHDRTKQEKQQAIERSEAGRHAGEEAVVSFMVAERGAKKLDHAVQEVTRDMDAMNRRSAAMGRLGFGMANMAQDVIQGGPASGVNNALFMAGDKGVRALITEGVAAAGGVKMIATAFGTVAVAAAGAFGVIDAGLHSAGLGWKDFGSVIANTAPIQVATSAFETLYSVVAASPIGTIFSYAWDTAKSIVSTVADFTIGWTAATEEVVKHNREVAETTKAINEAAAAQKKLAGIKSDAQKEVEDRGKLVGKELANLGGEKGIEGVVGALARTKVGMHAGEEVDQEFTDDKGNKQTRKVTRQQLAEEEIRRTMVKATEGDTKALAGLMPQLKKAGFDTRGVADAGQGIDWEKRNDADAKENDKRAKATEAKKKKQIDDVAKDLQTAVPDAIASGIKTDKAWIKSHLETAGLDDVGPEIVDAIFEKVDKGVMEAVKKRARVGNLSMEDAAKAIVHDAQQKQIKAEDARQREDRHLTPDEKEATKQAKVEAKAAERETTHNTTHHKAQEAARQKALARQAIGGKKGIGAKLLELMRNRRNEADQEVDQDLFDKTHATLMQQGMSHSDADTAGWAAVKHARAARDAKKLEQSAYSDPKFRMKSAAGAAANRAGQPTADNSEIKALGDKLDKLVALGQKSTATLGKLEHGVPAVLS